MTDTRRRNKPWRPYARGGPWRPAMTHSHYDRPEVGAIIALQHAVWRVTAVNDVPLTPDEIERKANHPWKTARTSYEVRLKRVGGSIPGHPEWKSGTQRISFTDHYSWEVYRDGRWPKCSCCGEPMPCTSAIRDDVVGAELDKIDEMDSRLPGTCWGCGDPISNRQQAIRYVGENVDHPGGIPVVFHLRRDCREFAVKYEEKWLAAETGRRRILTYPECPGTLLTHRDGSHECVSGDPECQGGISHDHGHLSTCLSSGNICSRGCPKPTTRAELWGCDSGRKSRPALRDPDLPQGRIETPDGPSDIAGAADARVTCPGHLLFHQDGTKECVAGGRDDCWGGDTYRHETRRDCRKQTHGCAKCGTGGGL
jgi:hypothetical protein